MSTNLESTLDADALGQVSGTGHAPARSKILPFTPREPRRDWQPRNPGAVFHGELANTLVAAISEAQLTGTLGGLAVVRLDEFSAFTEGFGYQTGQQLSGLFQRRLREALRDGDRLEPLSEDEFALLLGGVEQPVDLTAILESLLGQATGSYHLEGMRFHLGASAGIALFPADAANPDDLLRYARVALRQSDPFGRPAFQFFSREILQRAQHRMSVAAEVRQALAEDRLVLHYQPQYDLASGRIVAAEALLRFRDEEGCLVPPAHFIDIIEETALIVSVGHWVIQQACQQLRRWREAGLPLERITINLAPRQLMDGDLLPVIQDALDASGLDYADLEIEITERQMIDQLPVVVPTLNRLTNLGVRVAVDDFGTGYSSLAYLAQLPLNLLKIDRSFLRHGDHDDRTVRVVAAIIAMARELGLEVIAEGIEQPEQEQGLRELGCQLGQGFAFSRPITATQFEGLLRPPAEHRP
jgi:EAL domain-containing protein (putative c-di-GMP-specific phosphodiesterase class I)/GGDEF domain-containing protein